MIDQLLRGVLWCLHWICDRIIEAILRLEALTDQRAARVATKSPETPAPAERPPIEEVETGVAPAPVKGMGEPARLWN